MDLLLMGRHEIITRQVQMLFVDECHYAPQHNLVEDI